MIKKFKKDKKFSDLVTFSFIYSTIYDIINLRKIKGFIKGLDTKTLHLKT